MSDRKEKLEFKKPEAGILVFTSSSIGANCREDTRAGSGEGFAYSNKISNMGFCCALLVVFIHCYHGPKTVGTSPWMIWYLIRYVLGTIAVPFFFLVSGYFLARHCDEDGWWSVAVKKRFRTLAVPYLIWNAVAFPVLLCRRYAENGVFERPTVNDCLVAFGLRPLSMGADYPLWYVRALCFFVLLSPLLFPLVRKFGKLFLLVLFVLYVCVSPGHVDTNDFWLESKWRDFWMFGFSLEGLFYFSVGIFLSIRKVELSRSAYGWLMMGGELGLMRMFLKINGLCDYGLLIPMTIPLVLIGVWGVVPNCKWDNRLVGASFAVYVLHVIIIYILKILNPFRLIPASDELGVNILVEWGLVVTLSLLITLFLRRMMPKISIIAFGGR